jgi:DNA invertase Pin-like site-specific DNA recombinase
MHNLYNRNVIAYFRVSTRKQGGEGLGMAAQQEAVAHYIEAHKHTLIRSYAEVESGKRRDRPQLALALADARYSGSLLLVAKLDRLSRDTRFLLELADSKVDLAFCDLPQLPPGHLGRFILTIFVAVAELERGQISQRTKDALAAFRSTKAIPKRLRELYPEGVPAEIADAVAGRLGASRPGAFRFNGNPPPSASRKAGDWSRRQADDVAERFGPEISEWRNDGLSLREIAARLNGSGHSTRRGKPWTHVQVGRLLHRFDAESSPRSSNPTGDHDAE